MSWMLAAFFICGASAFTSCSNNDDNPVVDNSLIDGQWVEEETTYSEYFADGPLFCFRWQKPGQEGRHENWEIVSCTGSEMVNKALHRRTDGSTYTITAHLKKVE